jgi:uncharacterized membrane protein YcaP (DUF421 family)
MTVIDSIFGLKDQVSWWQECARAVLIFAYGLALVRVAGRRVFGKWAAIDIIVSIIIGSSLSRAVTGNAALFGTLTAMTLLIGLHWILSHAAARSPRLSRLLEGDVIELARDGERRPSTLVREAISDSDVKEALRQSGVEHVSDTRLIVLEPSGKITVVKAK